MWLRVDTFAYTNRLSTLHPAYKVGISALALGVCLAFDQPLTSALVLGVMWVLMVGWADIPWRAAARLLTAESGFLLGGVLSVALSVGDVPSGLEIAGLGIRVGVSAASLQHASNVFLRVLGSIAALDFLALTTPVPDLLELLRCLRAPEALVEVMGLTYRFIFVLLDSLERMRRAHDVRLGFANRRAALRSTALIGANLFIEAFRRGQRLELALRSRAWSGSLRVLPRAYTHPFRR